MDYEGSAYTLLECMLLDESAEPKDLPLSFLKFITNNFSDDQEIGRGGFATVYKGILQNGSIAVKKLSQAVDMDEKNFNQEVTNLIRVKHKNIVRFLGYCADTQGKVEKYQGMVVMADVRQRLLCFEFLPNGGLDGYISDASQGLEWRTRYQIIKGICEGLDYLHQKKMVHLDLKPANILLNSNMVPKIADFGLSRCFDEKQSWTITSKLVGSLGYLAPEFFSGVITLKSDIYSLGIVIIEILTGQKGYPAIENVLDSWSDRFEKSKGEKINLEQIRVCAEIGLECIESNPAKRPTTQRIIETLNEMESRYDFYGTCKATPSSAPCALPPKVLPGNHQCGGPDPFLVAQQVPDAESDTGSSRSKAAQQEQQMHGVRPERAKRGSEGSTMLDGSEDFVPIQGVRNASYVDSTSYYHCGRPYGNKRIIVDRDRRRKMNERLFRLRSLVPNITKMDMTSTIEDAINYIEVQNSQLKALKGKMEDSSMLPDDATYDRRSYSKV